MASKRRHQGAVHDLTLGSTVLVVQERFMLPEPSGKPQILCS